MSLLFSPLKLADLEIGNRFVHSATYEATAGPAGEVTEAWVRRYRNLARGQVGLMITGHLYVHALGRAFKHQAGIHRDEMIPGLKGAVDAVHREGGKIVFQLAHAGRQTLRGVTGKRPMGPSGRGRDPIYFVRPREMTEEDIQEVIRAFGRAARRAMEAGADGVQIHAAHGYLVNQFLSPFFNHRKDGWGGSDENRFCFLQDIFRNVKANMPAGKPVLVKLSSHDHTPREGITPDLAVKYAARLADLGIDGLEVSCGTAVYSFMNMCRGDVPADELVRSLPLWKRPVGRLMMKALVGKFGLREGYNLEAARMIKPVLKGTPLLLVGGMRRAAHMEEILKEGDADLISMSRPFIREPFVVKKIREGRADGVSCVSCNRCLAAIPNHLPIRCYNRGLPTG